MTPSDDDPSALAGEYALGLLTGEERDRFERRMVSEPVLQRLVAQWQHRMQPLVEAVEPVEPSPLVWQRIEASLTAPSALRQQRPLQLAAPRVRWWERIGFWRAWALGATAAVAGLAALLVLRPAQPAPRLIAVLSTASGQPAVLFTTELPGGAYRARAIQDISASVQAHQLWLLPGGNAAPISLGLLAPDSMTRRDLPMTTAALVRPGAAVAVSQEPPGGSPTGQPTGPVVYVGTLIEDQG